MSFFTGDAKPVVYDYESRDGAFLDDDNDAFNDETFGGGAVGKDFDFAGATAKVAGTIDEEHAVAERSERNKLQPLAELWAQPQQPQQQPQQLTLQQLEQQMIQGLQMGGFQGGFPQQQGQYQQFGYPQGFPQPQGFQQPQGQPGQPPFYGYQYPMWQGQPQAPGQPQGQPQMDPNLFYQQMYQGQQPQGQPQQQQAPEQQVPEQPQQPQQVPQHQPQQQPKQQQQPASAPAEPASAPEPSAPAAAPASAPTAAPQSIAQTIAQQQKGRAERERGGRTHDHSDRVASSGSAGAGADRRFNGLMGQWDKNFILNIQLQQLISQDPYNEDFYYQVHTAIKARENPSEPLSNFAKTYLFRSGQRYRRRGQSSDPLQRLHEQLQEAAKRVAEKAKNRAEKTAEINKRTEGSLGGQAKSSNAAHPRTALVLPETNLEKRKDSSSYDKEYILRALEEAYDAVLTLEAHDRARPPPDHPEAGEWAAQIPEMQDQLWEILQVPSPLDSQAKQPFILMLAHDKGKKLIPRAWPHLDHTRRLTILTRVFHQFDELDVIRDGAYPGDNTTDISVAARKAVDLFGNTVLQPLQHFIGELDLDVVISLFDLLLAARCGIAHICQTRIGQAIITIMISRAETITQESTVDPTTLQQWRATFERLFEQIQPHVAKLFPPRHVENSYVWHFLASLAIAATLDHQRLLVDGVRDRIFSTMAEAKSLPLDVGTAKITNLNLFLNVMGLNATFDDISQLE